MLNPSARASIHRRLRSGTSGVHPRARAAAMGYDSEKPLKRRLRFSDNGRPVPRRPNTEIEKFLVRSASRARSPGGGVAIASATPAHIRAAPLPTSPCPGGGEDGLPSAIALG